MKKESLEDGKDEDLVEKEKLDLTQAHIVKFV